MTSPFFVAGDGGTGPFIRGGVELANGEGMAIVLCDGCMESVVFKGKADRPEGRLSETGSWEGFPSSSRCSGACWRASAARKGKKLAAFYGSARIGPLKAV